MCSSTCAHHCATGMGTELEGTFWKAQRRCHNHAVALLQDAIAWRITPMLAPTSTQTSPSRTEMPCWM